MIEKETEKANVKEMKQRENELKEKKIIWNKGEKSEEKIKNLIKKRKMERKADEK